MDVLRLLTRSTNLQNRSVRTDRSLPSAGAPSHPQFLAEVDQNDHNRGVKRKRDQGRSAQADKPLPDFFSEQEALEDVEHVSIQAIQGGAKRDQGPFRVLSQDECMKVLQSHKIKIHLLETPSSHGVAHGNNAKSDGDAEKSSKIRKVPLHPCPLLSFDELHERYGISTRLLRNLADQGFTKPTEIQLAALPLLLDRASNVSLNAAARFNANHLLTVAPTGSGKTLAFLLSLINDTLAGRQQDHTSKSTASSRGGVTSIILAPTHELVDQIVNEARRICTGIGVKVSAMQKHLPIGQGHSDGEDAMSTQNVKSDILVSTPALISNFLKEKSSGKPSLLPNVRNLVLDEADILLDALFREDTLTIWRACKSASLRVSLWSATMGSSVETLVCGLLMPDSTNATAARRETQIIRVIAGLKDSAIPNVDHRLIYTASEQGKLLAMRNLLHPPSSAVRRETTIRPPYLVFTQTITRAIALHSELLYDIPVEAGGSSRIAVLHSDLSMTARSDTMARFRRGEIWILITTDILSRGVDFRGVNGVVNYDVPNSSANYVHRAGRTGRGGREGGVCVTFYTKDDIPYVKHVANVISAAEGFKGIAPDSENSAVPRWLMKALPDLTKQTKKELRRKGLKSRRDGKGSSTKERARSRISTKSGHERRIENQRKAARASRNPQHNTAEPFPQVVESDAGEEFDGFDD